MASSRASRGPRAREAVVGVFNEADPHLTGPAHLLDQTLGKKRQDFVASIGPRMKTSVTSWR